MTHSLPETQSAKVVVDVGLTGDEEHMINRDDNPVQWVLWFDELKEAHEPLGVLIDEFESFREYPQNLRPIG